MVAGRVVSFSLGSRASCASSFAREKGPKRVEIIETSGGLKMCRSNIGIAMAMLPSELEPEKGAGVESSALIIFAREGGQCE